MKTKCAVLTNISNIFSTGFLNGVIIAVTYNATRTEKLIKAIIFNYKA